MAIEISTRSIERFAQHEAKRTEQKARGELERQKLQNEEVCDYNNNIHQAGCFSLQFSSLIIIVTTLRSSTVITNYALWWSLYDH